MSKSKKITHLFFHFLLSKDIWCVLAGIIFASILTPKVCQTRENIEIIGKIVVWIMIMTLGWTITIWPAKKISRILQSFVKKLHNKYI